MWLGTLLYFALRSAGEMTWTDLFVALVSAVVVCVWVGWRASTFSNWRVFGLVLLAQLLAHAWLQWQGQLWDTPLQNGHALVALLAWDSFWALLFVSALLLIRRDASGIALAAAWLGCPIGLALTMTRYPSAAQLENLPLRDSSILLVAMCLLGFFAIGGSVAFVVHFLRLLYLELAAKA